MAWKFNCRFERTMTDDEGNMIITLAVVGRYKSLTKRAIEEIKGLKENMLTAKLTEYKTQRSNEQNNLMWGLLEKIVVADTGRRREDDMHSTYLQMLELAGAKYEYMQCIPEAEELLKRNFRAVKFIESRAGAKGKVNIYKCFYGSSDFDVKEMTEFIDLLFDELAKRGIYDAETEYWKQEFETQKQRDKVAAERKSKREAKKNEE